MDFAWTLFMILIFSTIHAMMAFPTGGRDRRKVHNKHPFRGMQQDEYAQMEECMKKLKMEMAAEAGHPITINEITDTMAGDIALTLEQCEELRDIHEKQKDPQNKDHGRGKRKALDFSRSGSSKWSFPVRYYIDMDYFTSAQASTIEKAFQLWEERTCLRFQRVDAGYRSQHLEIEGKQEGCWSYIGRTSLKTQLINTQPNGCYLGSIVHEIAHAMGLIHEQSRTDRDSYVVVHFENVRSGSEVNFRKDTDTVNLNVVYDYASLMQYRRNSFSTNGQFTLDAKQPIFGHTMGQRSDMSFMDITVMNRLYNCLDSVNAPIACRYPQITCHNGGYPDPGINTLCTTCRCPAGLKGDCTQAADGSSGCSPGSGNIDVTSTSESCLQSPNYPRGSYIQGDKCSWLLKAPPGRQIQLRFDTTQGFSVYFSTAANGVCHHWVEIKYTGNLTETGPRFCGSTLYYLNHNLKMESVDEQVVVDFRSEYPPYPGTNRMAGFKLCYKLKAIPTTPAASTTKIPAVTTTIKAPTTKTTTKVPTTTTTLTTEAPITTTTTTTTNAPPVTAAPTKAPTTTAIEAEVFRTEEEITTTEMEITTAEEEITTAEEEMTTTEEEITTTEMEITTTEIETTTFEEETTIQAGKPKKRRKNK